MTRDVAQDPGMTPRSSPIWTASCRRRRPHGSPGSCVTIRAAEDRAADAVRRTGRPRCLRRCADRAPAARPRGPGSPEPGGSAAPRRLPPFGPPGPGRLARPAVAATVAVVALLAGLTLPRDGDMPGGTLRPQPGLRPATRRVGAELLAALDSTLDGSTTEAGHIRIIGAVDTGLLYQCRAFRIEGLERPTASPCRDKDGGWSVSHCRRTGPRSHEPLPPGSPAWRFSALSCRSSRGSARPEWSAHAKDGHGGDDGGHGRRQRTQRQYNSGSGSGGNSGSGSSNSGSDNSGSGSSNSGSGSSDDGGNSGKGSDDDGDDDSSAAEDSASGTGSTPSARPSRDGGDHDVVRDEIIAIDDIERSHLPALRQLGFRPIEERPLRRIGGYLLRLRVPPGRRRRSLAPGCGNVFPDLLLDVHQLYRSSGTVSLPPPDYPRRLVGWGSARGRLHRRRRRRDDRHWAVRGDAATARPAAGGRRLRGARRRGRAAWRCGGDAADRQRRHERPDARGAAGGCRCVRAGRRPRPGRQCRRGGARARLDGRAARSSRRAELHRPRQCRAGRGRAAFGPGRPDAWSPPAGTTVRAPRRPTRQLCRRSWP